MRTITALGVALAIVVSACSRPSGAAAAADAMGATDLNSIQFTGSGTNYAFGQAYTPGGPWPRFEVKTYTVAIDYQTPAMKLEMLRAQGEHPPRGGGAQPFANDQRTIQVVSGKHAWTEGAAQPAPNPAAVSERLRQIWLTPHGVVKAALASGAPTDSSVFSFKVDDRDVRITLNSQNLVEKVEYLTTNSVVGDVPVELTYSDYAQFGNIQFPKHIVGFNHLDGNRPARLGDLAGDALFRLVVADGGGGDHAIARGKRPHAGIPHLGRRFNGMHHAAHRRRQVHRTRDQNDFVSGFERRIREGITHSAA